MKCVAVDKVRFGTFVVEDWLFLDGSTRYGKDLDSPSIKPWRRLTSFQLALYPEEAKDMDKIFLSVCVLGSSGPYLVDKVKSCSLLSVSSSYISLKVGTNCWWIQKSSSIVSVWHLKCASHYSLVGHLIGILLIQDNLSRFSLGLNGQIFHLKPSKFTLTPLNTYEIYRGYSQFSKSRSRSTHNSVILGPISRVFHYTLIISTWDSYGLSEYEQEVHHYSSFSIPPYTHIIFWAYFIYIKKKGLALLLCWRRRCHL